MRSLSKSRKWAIGVAAVALVGLMAAGASARPSGPTSAKASSIQVCALLPDTKSSTRYTLFDAPYLKAAFAQGRRWSVGPERARRPAEAAVAGRAVPRAGREGHPARPAVRRPRASRSPTSQSAEARRSSTTTASSSAARRPTTSRSTTSGSASSRAPASSRGSRRRASTRRSRSSRSSTATSRTTTPSCSSRATTRSSEPALQERHVQEGQGRRPVHRLGSDQGTTDLRSDPGPERQQGRRLDRGERRPRRGRHRVAEGARPQADPADRAGRDTHRCPVRPGRLAERHGLQVRPQGGERRGSGRRSRSSRARRSRA